MRVCAAVLGLFLLSGACSPASQTPSIVRLPVPFGTYAIGMQSFPLIDSARSDQISAKSAEHRELMIYIWYPAQRINRKQFEAYLPGARKLNNNPAAQQAMRDEFEDRWPSIVSGSLQSHAISGASPAIHPGGFPVVLFSHGLISTSFAYTAQVEDLVSHGYVVVAIDHTDMAAAILFPDGHIRTFRRIPPAQSQDTLQAMISAAREQSQIGAEDVRFVLDSLTRQKTSLVKVMDLKRVAAVGHSAGGTLTARTCQLDPRIKACISEDGAVNPVGAFFDYPDHALMTHPFLLIEIDQPAPTDQELARIRLSKAQWENYLAHKRLQFASCKAGSYHVMLHSPGMVHASFSDEPILSAASGSREASAAARNLILIETLNRAFLDKYLKHKTAPLLDQLGQAPLHAVIEQIGK